MTLGKGTQHRPDAGPSDDLPGYGVITSIMLRDA